MSVFSAQEFDTQYANLIGGNNLSIALIGPNAAGNQPAVQVKRRASAYSADRLAWIVR
jgi:hypothetical protein